MKIEDLRIPRIDRLMVDDRTRGIFRVHRSVFTSEAVLELERRKIFDRSWLYLAHESEVADPGGFVARRVAGRPVLLTRDLEGKLHALLNTCAHRGAVVCREPCGNARSFTCGYHAWTYNLKGELTGQPGKEAYSPEACAGGQMNLPPVPKLGVFRGFIFVCFDAGADGLENYLAGACEYLDLVACQAEERMVVVKGTHEYSVRANWKLLQENSADGYHAAYTHSTYFDYLRARDSQHGIKVHVPTKPFGAVKDLGNGHAVSESMGSYTFGRPVARWIPEWGEEGKRYIEAKRKALITRLGEKKAMLVAESDRNLLIFPNLVVNDIMAVTIRTFYPTSPGYFDVNAWALAPAEESGAALQRRLHNFLEFLGPAGFASPDDVEMLELCQQGYANQDCAPWNDLSRGMPWENERASKTEELQMRTFWRRWHGLLGAS